MQDRWNQKIFNYDQFSWALSGQLAEWSLALLSGEKIFENRKDPRFAPRPGQTFKLIWSILSHIKSWCHKVTWQDDTDPTVFRNRNSLATPIFPIDRNEVNRRNETGTWASKTRRTTPPPPPLQWPQSNWNGRFGGMGSGPDCDFLLLMFYRYGDNFKLHLVLRIWDFITLWRKPAEPCSCG